MCVCADLDHMDLLVEPSMKYSSFGRLGLVPLAGGGEGGVLIREDSLVLRDDVKQMNTTQLNRLHNVLVGWRWEGQVGEGGEGDEGEGDLDHTCMYSQSLTACLQLFPQKRHWKVNTNSKQLVQ